MRWTRLGLAGVVLTAAGLSGCNRSDLLDEIRCPDEGRYVVVQSNAFCVYPEQGVFPCPEALPFPVEYARSGFCAIEESPPEALLAAALLAALERDAGPADATTDGFTTVDAGTGPDFQADRGSN